VPRLYWFCKRFTHILWRRRRGNERRCLLCGFYESEIDGGVPESEEAGIDQMTPAQQDAWWENWNGR
jgi:hypothetical protein